MLSLGQRVGDAHSAGYVVRIGINQQTQRSIVRVVTDRHDVLRLDADNVEASNVPVVFEDITSEAQLDKAVSAAAHIFDTLDALTTKAKDIELEIEAAKRKVEEQIRGRESDLFSQLEAVKRAYETHKEHIEKGASNLYATRDPMRKGKTYGQGAIVINTKQRFNFGASETILNWARTYAAHLLIVTVDQKRLQDEIRQGYVQNVPAEVVQVMFEDVPVVHTPKLHAIARMNVE